MEEAALETNRAKLKRVLGHIEAHIGTPEPHEPAPPLDELVATILSQNTSDTNSHRASAALTERFPTWRSVRDASREALIDTISVGGLAPTKARTIQEFLGALEEVDGEPSLGFLSDLDDQAAVEALAGYRGVGVKTAACVLLFALERDVCPVDTHVHRVSNRLGLVATKHRDRTHEALAATIPAAKAYVTHVLFVRFGRRVCKARSPLCHECPLYDECAWDGRHATAETYVERERRTTDLRPAAGGA